MGTLFGTGTTITVTVVGAAADGAAVSGNPVLVAGSDGTNAERLLVDSSGQLRAIPSAGAVAGSTIHATRNLAATVTAVKTSAGTLYGVQVLNNQGSTAFIQIFNVAAGSVILATTTPDLEFQVGALASATMDLPSVGVQFTTAISVASTTTEGGSTGSGSGVQFFAQYA